MNGGDREGQPQTSEAVERFELTLVAEQGRYAEALRRMAELVREEFAEFTSPPDESLREKLAVLDSALATMSELGDRIERLRMVAQAVRSHAEASDPDERERARHALLLALGELDRHVPIPRTAGEPCGCGSTEHPGQPTVPPVPENP